MKDWTTIVAVIVVIVAVAYLVIKRRGKKA
jgi:hypothetical protein